MLIAFFLFMILGLLVAVTPGAVLGYAFVAVSGRVSRVARVALLVGLAALSAATWLSVLGADNVWRPSVVAVSFTATLASGITFLGREAAKRRALQRPAAQWPRW